MLASIIIITKNQKDLLQRSLPILLKQELKGEYEIIIVDSGSTDGAVEYIKSLPVKLIQILPEDFRFANAFNTGAKFANGEFLVRLSGDVVPRDKKFLSEIIKPFKDKKVGGTYGRYIQTGKKGYSHPNFWPPERFSDKIVRFRVKPNLLKIIFNIDHLTSLTNFAGACCAIRKSIWMTRHFNENILGGEDAEYAIYLHMKGFDIIYNPNAEVIHEHKIENLNAGFWKELSWRIVFSIEIFKLFLKS
ncbi:MAG TPA: glycosyltransferase family 2 protein [Patescibacteria group bacterium]|nr:glycosyltransferase family 2 protein [Patescibacteria group bacterium]